MFLLSFLLVQENDHFNYIDNMKKEGAIVKNNTIIRLFFGTDQIDFFFVGSVANQTITTIPPMMVMYNNCHQPDLPVSCNLREPADN